MPNSSFRNGIGTLGSWDVVYCSAGEKKQQLIISLVAGNRLIHSVFKFLTQLSFHLF